MHGPIVVGTDMRAGADRAIDRALQLGQEWGVTVTAVHAYDPAHAGLDAAEPEQRLLGVLPHHDVPVTLRLE